jgi:hypothetical protein
MKANAPERLYLSETIYSTYLYQVPDPDDESAVEYTRTNAFIEKVLKWISEIENGTTVTDIDKFAEEFKEAMKVGVFYLAN